MSEENEENEEDEEIGEGIQDEYFAMMQAKFGMKYPTLIKLAVLLQLNLEALTDVFSMSPIEKLGIAGLMTRLVGRAHLEQSVDEIDEMLSGTEDLEDI